MEEISKVYGRFISNYRNDNGGINLYPQFDKDLEQILIYVGDLITSKGEIEW